MSFGCLKTHQIVRINLGVSKMLITECLYIYLHQMTFKNTADTMECLETNEYRNLK